MTGADSGLRQVAIWMPIRFLVKRQINFLPGATPNLAGKQWSWEKGKCWSSDGRFVVNVVG